MGMARTRRIAAAAVPGGHEQPQGTCCKAIVEKAVTRAHIEDACACDSEFRAPIFDTLFLDAIAAHAAHDYRKSILDSAIAVESATATLLDEEYETKIRPSDATHWRTIRCRLPERRRPKDPIWELLKKREDANSLLHEGALYILGRSLLIENENLFQLVQRLRATRNKMSTIESHRNFQAISIYNRRIWIGGRARLVSAVFAWLGVRQDYKLGGGGLVPVANR